MTDFVTITTTTDTSEEANRLSTSAVEARLAACGQVSAPITSTYWWEGKVEAATEFYVVFKTRAELADRLTDHLKSVHSYDTPEVVVTPIIGGNPAYLAWVSEETATPTP
jgi:periplasmic divalent cation tolerance protein